MQNSQNKSEPKQDVKKMLKSISNRGIKQKETVIYGLYDNSAASFSTKINDFLIDHTRIGLKEKAYFFHLLAVMVDAGIPVLQALGVLSGKTENRRFQRIINTLVHSTSAGQSFSDSMARFPDVFTESELGVIRAGEAVGNLNKMLFKLSEQTERLHELQIKLVTAVTYPAVIFVTLIGVATAMLIWIIPTLIDLLVEGGLEPSEFPFATKALIAISAFLTGFWWAIALLGVILYALYNIYVKTEAGRFNMDYTKLKIPIVGQLIRKVLVLRFVSLLGILMEAGLPVIKTLQIIGGSMNSAPYEVKIWDVVTKVQAGEKISKNLMDAPFLFPETVTQMINIGENTASVGTISEKIAKHYDREIDHSLRRLTSIFEPVMILSVGIIVALLALAILMPIFDLTRLV